MTFYHYTSAENYESIKDTGLLPYHIRKPKLLPYFPHGIRGIWLWLEELKGDEHIGSVLWQLMTKASTCIVKLKVECNEERLLRQNGLRVEILHDGRLGAWDYHRGVPAVVMPESILASSITLLNTYDLAAMIS